MSRLLFEMFEVELAGGGGVGWGTEIVFNTSVRHTGPHSVEFLHTGGEAYLCSEPVPIASDYGVEGGSDPRAPTPLQYGLIAKAAAGGDKITVEVQGSVDWPRIDSWTTISTVTYGLATSWREIRRNPGDSTVGYNWIRLKLYRPNGSVPAGVPANTASVYVDSSWLGQVEPLARMWMLAATQAIGAGAWTTVQLNRPNAVGWGAVAGDSIRTSPSILTPFVGDVRIGQSGLYLLGAHVTIERSGAGVAQVQARILDVTNTKVIGQSGPFPTLTGATIVVPVASQLWDCLNPPYTGTDAARRVALQVYSDVAAIVTGGNAEHTALSLMRVGGRT